jgi:hypothetical protein
MVLGSIAQPLDVRNRRTYADWQMKANEWTEAHRREALRRTYELAAELVGRGEPNGPTNGKRAAWFLMEQIEATDYEKTWLAALGTALVDSARVNREVRRVRALVEGRLVRGTGERYRIRGGPRDGQDFDDLANARRHAAAAGGGWRIARLRVTCIRKASPT